MQSTVICRNYRTLDIQLTPDGLTIYKHADDRALTLSPQQSVDLWLALQTPGAIRMLEAIDVLQHNRQAFDMGYGVRPAPLTNENISALVGYGFLARTVGDISITIDHMGLALHVGGGGLLVITPDACYDLKSALASDRANAFFDSLDRELQASAYERLRCDCGILELVECCA